MSAESNRQSVRAYFLIDLTGTQEQYVFLIESELNNLLNRLASAQGQIESKVINMGVAACQLVEPSGANRFQLFRKPIGCDLGQALQFIKQAQSAQNAQVEVFVFLRGEPAGDWRARIQALTKNQQIRLHFFPFTGETGVHPKTVKEIEARWANSLIHLGQLTSQSLAWVFKNGVWPALHESFALSQARGEPSPRPETPQIQPPDLPIAKPDQALLQPSGTQKLVRTKPQAPLAVGDSDEGQVVATGLPEGFVYHHAVESQVEPPSGELDVVSLPDLGSDAQDETPLQPPGPPPVDEEGVATIWKQLEPPAELGDRVLHSDTKVLEPSTDWRMLAASQRGKMHAHRGIFREDAFALEAVEGWHLLVVADGGGSCSLSRIGSQLAADTALATMSDVVKSMQGAPSLVCQLALEQALRKAWEALADEAERREIALRELGTTFLALMHHLTPEGHILGVAQVGDGLVAAELVSGKIVALAEADVGETAGVTFFLTSKPWKEWIERVQVHVLDQAPLLLAAMCDGVADDFIPYERHLDKLFQGLKQVIVQEQPAQALLELLTYERRGSFDDRTLALIYQAQASQGDQVASSASLAFEQEDKAQSAPDTPEPIELPQDGADL